MALSLDNATPAPPNPSPPPPLPTATAPVANRAAPPSAPAGDFRGVDRWCAVHPSSLELSRAEKEALGIPVDAASEG
jgi:hypothetical protein